MFFVVYYKSNSQLRWDLNAATHGCESIVLPVCDRGYGSSPIRGGYLISNSCGHCMYTIC